MRRAARAVDRGPPGRTGDRNVRMVAVLRNSQMVASRLNTATLLDPPWRVVELGHTHTAFYSNDTEARPRSWFDVRWGPVA